MKAVLISIQPKWVEKIISDEKTLELRKTIPKLETPFKCYIYCTKSQGLNTLLYHGNHAVINDYRNAFESIDKPAYWQDGGGKVIGEFICDKIYEGTPDYNPFSNRLLGYYFEDKQGDYHYQETCLTNKELVKYGKGKTLYGWHISNLKIYDKPKELSEFYNVCKGVKGLIGCRGCENWSNINKCCKTNNVRRLSRPPQSWCYVEEL